MDKLDKNSFRGCKKGMFKSWIKKHENWALFQMLYLSVLTYSNTKSNIDKNYMKVIVEYRYISLQTCQALSQSIQTVVNMSEAKIKCFLI